MMAKSDENGMWNLVLFDLPVKTREQRRCATQFRLLLLDLGWSMEQFSVYVRYIPTGMSVVPEVQEIKRRVPAQGKVEIVGITDRQWSKAIRFFNAEPELPSEPPAQLTIF
jgi:CRISPR-associated protein Cas2